MKMIRVETGAREGAGLCIFFFFGREDCLNILGEHKMVFQLFLIPD